MTPSHLDELQSDIDQLSNINHAGIAIITFVMDLEEGGFEMHGGRKFTYRPNNFLTMSVHYKRANNITFTFRGNTAEFHNFEHCPLLPDMGGYSRAKFESILQMDAILYYIRRAHKLFHRGSGRNVLKEKLVEY